MTFLEKMQRRRKHVVSIKNKSHERDIKLFFDNVIGEDFRGSLSTCKNVLNVC